MKKDCFTQVSINEGEARKSSLKNGGYVLHSNDRRTLVYLDNKTTHTLLSVVLDSIDKETMDNLFKKCYKSYLDVFYGLSKGGK